MKRWWLLSRRTIEFDALPKLWDLIKWKVCGSSWVQLFQKLPMLVFKEYLTESWTHQAYKHRKIRPEMFIWVRLEKNVYILGTHECNFFYLKTFVVAKVGSNLWTKCTAGKAAGRGSLTVSTSAPASKSAAKCRTSPTSAATRSRSERVGRLRPNLSQATWSNQSNQSNANCEVQCFNTFWYRWYASIFQLSSK